MTKHEQDQLVKEARKLPRWDDYTTQWTDARREMMVRLYNNGDGMTLEKIGEIYGVTKQRVWKIINGVDASQQDAQQGKR